MSQAKIEMSAGLQLMAVVIPMCPLLGLIGTVSGMMEVFDAMSLRGKVNPQTLADGISHAMIATMTGLVVSVIGLFFSNLFASRVRVETERLNDLIAPG
jgi:biopolymer transport protein ExbB